MMKLIRHHPFALLALVTLVIGAVWHSGVVGPGLRVALSPVMSVMGAPFIAAMRLVSRHLGSSALNSLLGTLLGVAPYLLADFLFNRWRRRKTQTA